MRVFVLDKNKKPLNPTHPARARKILKSGRAKVFKQFPFTIILQDVEGGQTPVGFPDLGNADQERRETNGYQLNRVIGHGEATLPSLTLKIDPGSKTTGLAILQGNRVIWGAELTHRGQQIRDKLTSRRQLRRGRRSRKTRYRKPRFLNRKRPEGWLAKTHWLDAACVGKSTPEQLKIEVEKPLIITAKGHGTRQRCRPDKYGFPKAHAPKAKFFQGFQTGDIVKASILKGKYAGNYVGRIAIRFRPSFRLSTVGKKPFDVHPKYLKTIHHADGYEYTFNQ